MMFGSETFLHFVQPLILFKIKSIQQETINYKKLFSTTCMIPGTLVQSETVAFWALFLNENHADIMI